MELGKALRGKSPGEGPRLLEHAVELVAAVDIAVAFALSFGSA